MNVCCWYDRLFSLISELSKEITLVWEDWTPQLQGSHSLKPVMKPGSPCCKEPTTTQNYFIILAFREALYFGRLNAASQAFPPWRADNADRKKLWSCMFYCVKEVTVNTRWGFVFVPVTPSTSLHSYLAAFHKYTLHSSLACVLNDPCFHTPSGTKGHRS